MGAVEKLEQILHAEDAARVLVADARTEAARIAGDARASAAETVRAGGEETRALAESRRDEILAEARQRVLAFQEDAEAGSRATLEAAQGRTDDALAAVLAALKGR